MKTLSRIIAAVLFVPVMLVLAMQAAFTILNAIFPFVLGFTLAIGLTSGIVAFVMLPEEK